jgi:hypothetical protein
MARSARTTIGACMVGRALPESALWPTLRLAYAYRYSASQAPGSMNFATKSLDRRLAAGFKEILRCFLGLDPLLHALQCMKPRHLTVRREATILGWTKISRDRSRAANPAEPTGEPCGKRQRA